MKTRMAALLGMSLAALLLSAAPASAQQQPPEETRPDFQLPVPCGQTWVMFTYEDHYPEPGEEDQVQMRIDMQRVDGDTEGADVVASAAGTVRDHLEPGGVSIDHGNGWYSQYLHMSDRVDAGTEVEEGDWIGTASNVGTGVPHLHYQQAYDFDDKGYPNETTDVVYPVIQGDEYRITPGNAVNLESTNNCDGDPGEPEPADTSLAYSGVDKVTNGLPAELSAELTDEAGDPVQDRDVVFALGDGDDPQTCTEPTGDDGVATCQLDAVDIQVPEDGVVPLTVSFAGDDDYLESSIEVELAYQPEETTLDYTGDERIANGTSATMSAVLADTSEDGVADEQVTFELGSGDQAQDCQARTDADGVASCTIDDVNQPLTDDATVPVTASFAGSPAYLASDDADTVDLEHVQARAYGLAAEVSLIPLLPITIDPVPDTGQVRTAGAETVSPGCVEGIDAILLDAGLLCSEVVTRTGPSGATATSTLAEAEIGLPGLPVIELSGVRAESTSTCDGSDGVVDLTLSIAGTPVEIPDTPNVPIDVAGLAQLTINEQTPVAGADQGLTVTAVHLTGPGIDIGIGTVTSSAHNCA